MAKKFGTHDWAAALREEINASDEYREAADSWGVDFNGNLLFVFEADDVAPKPLSLMIKLAGGSCQDAAIFDAPNHPDAGFVLRGPYQLWREVLERKTMAATAIMTGKLQVEGERMQLLKHTAANRALMRCTSSVATAWD